MTSITVIDSTPSTTTTATIKKVLCVYSGGTIGMKKTKRGYAPAKGYLTEFVRTLPMFHDKDAEELIPKNMFDMKSDPLLGLPCISPLNDEYNERTVFRFLEYNPLLDSSNVEFKHWQRMAKDIVKYYDEYDAFVVLHGTDTMGFTSSALSFMLENLAKTVVVTGSQIPLSRPRNDGLMNLLGALQLSSHYHIPEVVVYFSSLLLRGCRTSKVDANNLDGFDSPNIRPLATVGIGYNINWALIRQPTYGKLILKDYFCNDISIIRVFPGFYNENIISSLQHVKGLILQTFGAGNAPEHPEFLKQLKDATTNGVIVVNVTQCQKGEVEAHYAAGSSLVEAGVISAGDMTPEAALVKLGWLLGSGMNSDDVRSKFVQDLRGEITVHEDSANQFSFENDGFAKAVFKVLQERNELNDNGSDGGNGESAVKSINDAILPTLVCHFSSTGALDELASIYHVDDADGRNDEDDNDKVSPDIADYDGRTGLHLACAYNQFEIVKFFIEVIHANINFKDNFGRTALREAVESKADDAIISYLVSNGAKLEISKNEAASKLCSLVEENNINLLEKWINGGVDVNVADYDKRTALHIAAACGSMEIIKFLLEHNADVALSDRFGNTPKEEAEREGREKNILELFV